MWPISIFESCNYWKCKKILICDSDELFRCNLRSVLKSKNFYIQEASRLSEAVKYVLKEKFNAIVFGLQSEDMNGIQIFSAIKAIDYKKANNRSSAEAAHQIITEYRNSKKRLSGFGHRLHTDDPRTKKLFSMADELKIAGEYISLAKDFEAELEKSLGKKLPINVDGAIAALLCEMEFDVIFANAFFMIARVPGLVAHIYEEKTRYKPMRKIHPTDVTYDGPEERSL